MDLPTLADFRARYPEFTLVPDGLAAGVLMEAVLFVDETWRDSDRAPAVLALAAHLLAREGEPGRSSTLAAGGSLATAPGSLGAVTGMSVGDVSVSYSDASSTSSSAEGDSAADYSTTAYGRLFLRLRARNFPAVMVV